MANQRRATHVHPGDRITLHGRARLVVDVEAILNRSAQRRLVLEDGSHCDLYFVQPSGPDKGVYKIPGSPFRDGYAFEAKVANRISEYYIICRWGGGPGDGGIDITARSKEDSHDLAVQCKHSPRSPVSRPIIEDFVRDAQGYDELVLVTTGELSNPAAQLASASGVTFIDYRTIESWLASETSLLRSEPKTT